MLKNIILSILKKNNIQDIKMDLNEDEINEFKNHPLFSHLNLTDDEIINNVSYLSKINFQDQKCALENKHYCPFNNQHIYVKRDENNKLYFYVDYCLKTKEEVLKNAYKKRILYNYYDNSVDSSNMINQEFLSKNMLIDSAFIEFKLSIIQKFCNETLKQNKTEGLYVYGPPGVGKTFITLALANTCAKKFNKTVCIVYMPEFVEIINSKISNKDNFETDEILENIKDCDVLFLDDLGSETASEWFYTNYFLNILNYRCSKNKLTFFNSNYSIKQFEQKLFSKIRNKDARNIISRISQRINKLVKEEIKIPYKKG